MRKNLEQHLKQKQSLRMNAELQQAIELLQYNLIELKDFLNQQVMDNPFIQLENTDYYFEASQRFSNGDEWNDNNWMESLPNDSHQSLYSSLYEQVLSNYRDTPIREVMIQLLDGIDDDGYLKEEKIKEFATIEPIQLLDAITLIQQLEPAGVGARSLQECLMLQTERDELSPPLTYYILEVYFDELVQQAFDTIAMKLSITPREVADVFEYIQHLTPRPGMEYGEGGAEYLYPEIVVQTSASEITYRLNGAMMPNIIFNQQRFNEYQEMKDDELQQYLKVKKQEFEWLKRALTKREQTLSRLAEAIIHFQSDYLNQKSSFPTGLTMKEVADWMGVHESTVSRLVKDKYMEWNGATLPFRFFFPTKVSKETDATKDMIHAALTELVATESKTTPYSDQGLSEQLEQRGLNVARRTVAKYRKELNIPSASQRKVKVK
ncbi:RNA polymerase factor sigma-54 [Atopobacter phocae]|uniref:RNA polymerase factor sigma-54 n=1 Tax=Atopobacter phocae TaxID=136492 RepID=UPI0004BC790E|nr:RNA polymerase factor sigma-54 [Atopobacter phocae]